MNHQTSSIPQIAYQSPQVTTKLMTELPFVDSSFAIPIFSPRDDPIACLNKSITFLTVVASLRYKSNTTCSRGNNASGHERVVKCYNCQGEGHMARQCTQPKRPRNATWYKDKAMLAEAQEARQILDEEQLAFLADPETKNLDTYDSNCDNISNAKAVLMANISNYGSDVISEVPHSQTYLNDMENQVEVPSELPKVSLVNASLKKLKFHLTQFDSVVKKRKTPNALEEGEWGFEHTKTVFNNEIIPFLKSLKDIFNVFDKDLLNEITEVFKDHFNSIKQTRVRHKEQNDSLINKLNFIKSVEIEDLKAQIQDKVFVITSLKNDLRKLKRKEIVENVVHVPSATTIAPGMFKLDLEPLPPRLMQNREVHITYLRNTQEQANILWEIVKQAKEKQPLNSALDLACKFGNDQIARIIGYGDYQLGNVIISIVYYIEGLGHNLFSVGQFCDTDLKVAFWKNTCFIRNLEGVDLLLGSRNTNLYTISLYDMPKSSSISLLSKASKNKSCMCIREKQKKSSHQPKAEDTNQEKLYLLHMDLCGPMRVASINGKRYILVIVDDYSRFTWVRFLKIKDEAPTAIIKYIKNIQVRLKATVRNVRTDNEAEFANQTLREWYENVGITHQTSVARTPQQNGVVERRNWTLVEAARTMLIFSKALLFLWAEAINTACYTQNRSLIRL
ncbi:retrovirus-related pol polyprotein from transposon TNT 1-94 [Tanacetum coccineum]